jgi:predicted phage tail protein
VQSKNDGKIQTAEKTLEDTRAELRRKQADIRNAGKKWDNWLADETRKYDEVLKEFENRYMDLERSATAITTNVALMRAQLERFRQFQSSQDNPTPTFATPANVALGSTTIASFTTNNQIALSDMQLEVEQQKLSIVLATQQEVSRRANAVLADRKAIVQEYQAATGKVTQQAEALKKWDQRAKKQAEDAKKNADKKPASLASLETKIRSLSTYDPYRFDVARARLLSEYTVAPETSKE